MPSTYAHYKFGKEILKLLPREITEVIEGNKSLYMTGLHGPDILFYYKPLSKNEINTIGYALHEKEAVYFFLEAFKKISNIQSKNAPLSYIYGFLCHYALDCECHKYIDEQITRSGISHAEIEVEFDRMLMIEDGLNPITQNLTTHINTVEKDCNIISAFFNGISPKQIEHSLNSMKICHKLLLARSNIKRNFLYAILKITGNYPQMHGLIVNKEPNPGCLESNRILAQKYTDAQAFAVSLIMEFSQALTENNPQFSKRFFKTFSGKEAENIAL